MYTLHMNSVLHKKKSGGWRLCPHQRETSIDGNGGHSVEWAWGEHWWIASTYRDIPDTGTVEEEGVSLADLSDVGQVPDVETVVIVHHCYLNNV